MLGLKKHTVEIVEHQSDWHALAVDACQKVQIATSKLLAEVQHVGSTAVPGLLAKPILDIAAGIKNWELVPEIITRMTDIGYIYRGDAGVNGGHLFVWESSPNIRTIHVHVVEYNGSQWNNYLLFRDLLRQDSQIRRQYAELKEQLKSRYPNNRKAYTAGKRGFVMKCLEQAHSNLMLEK